ncbi:50S ribosomal protein L21e [Candidatus Woesearchaeota archaeon]|nr:50S ribosomal protein L21e [Candidatus Woesearchaeota archaeon]
MQRIGGFRRKTRHKFKKNLQRKGKLSLKNYFQLFKAGERVYLTVEPNIQKGMYNPAFLGKTAVIKGKRGRCYEVLVKDINKYKTLIVHPIHLKRI